MYINVTTDNSITVKPSFKQPKIFVENLLLLICNSAFPHFLANINKIIYMVV